MFGYDWPRLHAALNDFPAALLLVSVLFDLAGTILKRESLKTVGFWTLLTGVAGTAAAVVAGLLTEDVIDHSDPAHALMERHETFGLAVLGVFTVLGIWRLVRRGTWRPRELPFALAAGTVGVGLMVYTANLGGQLVFDHALGIPTARLGAVVTERGGEAHEHTPGEEHDMEMADSSMMDSASTRQDSANASRIDESKPHTHADSTAHTRKRAGN